MLLGCYLQRGPVVVRITEVEAYAGASDPASHAYAGPTARNRVMFGPAGFLYVYRLHGHHCCNVICGPDGEAAGVLIRAGEVVAGLEQARARRGDLPAYRLARGPGCLTRALGITMAEADCDLLTPDAPVRLLARPATPAAVSSGPRVGVSRAADEPNRLWLTGDPTVSAYRRSPRATG